MEKKAIRGAIFDLDGTLVHTTVDFRIMKRRLFEVLTEEGIPSSLLDDKATMSRSLALVRQHILDHGLANDMDRISAAVTASMNGTEMERVAGTTAIDGALRCLRSLQENGIMIGLLTRGSRSYAKAALHHAGITIPFRAMVCRDDHPEDEANGKALRRTMNLMDLQPRDCLLVGDHVMDMECAVSASVRFLGVLSGSFTQGDWERYGCRSTIESVGVLLEYLEDGNLYLHEED
jgi:phosphoglycolate phosphatase-like HAD superfamily hydrolase